MEIRKAAEMDLPEIFRVYQSARKFMEQNGNPDQWKDGYPSPEIVKKDLKDGNLYLCVEGEKIEGVFVFFLGEEPSYRIIEGGDWLNDRPYGTLHRIASAGGGRGAASFCINWCFQQCRNMRGDTHECNRPMQRVFEKNGFVRCGIIYLSDGSPRIAYQKTE